MKRRKRRDKALNQRDHFVTRVKERFGIIITYEEYQELVELIQKQKTYFLESQSNNRTLHLMNIQGKRVKVVYDKKHKTLVTALPLEELSLEYFKEKYLQIKNERNLQIV